MENFIFQNTTKIIFGKNTEQEIGNEIKEFGNKVLLLYGGGSIKKNGFYDKIVNSLNNVGISIFELSGVKPNPRLSQVEKGIEICRNEKIDSILAVGGGSVIDSAKAIGIGVPYDGDVWDFFEGKSEIKDSLPIGVVLTIPAAGSESSTASIITNEVGWYKRAINSNIIRPKFAILNPEVTYTLPIHQTVAGAADIMAHVFERYFTNVQDVDFTDRLCEVIIKTIIKNLPIVLKEPENYVARAEIMWAGTLAHNELLDTGRLSDWGTHMIAHEISGIYDVTHGVTVSIISPAWMKYVYKHNINRFAKFAVNVWDVENDFEHTEKTALEGIERLEKFLKEVGLPINLKEVNVFEDRFEEMAKKCTKAGKVGNFVKLSEEDVLNILKIAM